jgi:hypothetical protein
LKHFDDVAKNAMNAIEGHYGTNVKELMVSSQMFSTMAVSGQVKLVLKS